MTNPSPSSRHQDNGESPRMQQRKGSSWLVRGGLLAVSLVVLAGAALLSFYWISNRPKATRGRPPERIPLVKTVPLEKGRHEVTIKAMGTVIPAETVNVTVQVKGVVTDASPALVPGGHIAEGERLVQIEPEDFRLAVKEADARLAMARLAAKQRKLLISKARSSVAQAEQSLELEKGQQDVARREFELLGEKIPEKNRALVLRKPQLNTAQAAYEAALASEREAETAYQSALESVKTSETALRNAQLALERASVSAPFNGVVKTKFASKGSYLVPGNPIVTLVNTDVYWVRVPVPVRQLKWITTAQDDREDASRVELVYNAWEAGRARTGRVLKLAPDLEQGGRMAQVIVEAPDPRSLRSENTAKPQLMLGALMHVVFHGAHLPACVRIPRSALHEGDTIWLKTMDSTLDIRRIRIVARLEDAVLARDGFQTGDRLVVSDLGAPVQGMNIQEPGEETGGKR